MVRDRRKLMVIVTVDAVEYSRLMGQNESATYSLLQTHLAVRVAPSIARNRGRIVKYTGDGALAEFDSAVNALSAVIELQQAMADANRDQPEDTRIVFRAGLHLGEVLVEQGELFGDDVNIAVRLQTQAPPGGILISRSVREAVEGRVNVRFHELGELPLKNIVRPIQAFRVEWNEADWRPHLSTANPSHLVRPPAGSAGTATLALPEKPSIAVLPFENMSNDPDQEHLADGIVESLTATLSRIRSFFVIARASAFTYKGRPIDLRDVGRELGVAYLVEGSVQHRGSRLRVSVQLIETTEGAHLWAEKYDGSLDDVFDLQDRIAEQVAGAVHPSIRLAEIERARRQRPQDLGAYGLTMRAMRHVWRLDKSEADRGLHLLEQALEIDPDYPLALALAAWCWAQRSVYNWTDDISGAIAQALQFAGRVTDRADGHSAEDPLVLAVLGAVHTFARNHGVARLMLERALALDPNAAWAHSRLGWLHVYGERPEEAKVHFEKALRLSPLDPVNFNNYVGLAAARTVAGDDVETVVLLTRALQEQPGAIWIHRTLAAALYGAGRHDEALRSRDIMLEAHPGLTIAKFREAMVFSPKTLDRISAQLRALGIPEG